MDVLKEGKYFRYVEKAPIWLAISAVVIVIGLVFMFANKAKTGSFFNLSIHYTGGQKIILQMLEEVEADGQNVKQIVEGYAQGEPIVQVDQTDLRIVTIRMRIEGDATESGGISSEANKQIREMKQELGDAYGGYSNDEGSQNPVTLEQDQVGPTVGGELINKAIWALVIGCILIMLYILMRFGRWQMSFAAIGALIHDVLITLGFTAILGLEVSDSFIAVILTIIGYSINDTIIIFDRVRENLKKYGDQYPLPQVCNLSLNQTLIRSVNTVVTVIIMIVALMVIGGSNIRDFLTAMLIGMISGGYSSIFVATPLMLWLTKGKLKAEEVSQSGAAAIMSPPMELDASAVGGDTTVAEMVKDKKEKKKKVAKKQRRR